MHVIDRIEGDVVQIEPTHVVLDVGGVGFHLAITLGTYESIGRARRAALLTHLHVREDILALYGFAETAERDAFRTLIGISGVGPRVAQAILSSISVDTLREAVTAGDWKRLTAAPGVGRKLAERMVVELRGKLGDLAEEAAEGAAPEGYAGRAGAVHETVQALVALGHNPVNADKLARKAVKSAGEEASVEELIRLALRS
jgi:Holliday junction DNA helicase RuvA